MSDASGVTVEQQDQSQQEDPESASSLRRAANDGKAARAEAEAAKRELAFLKAGIDTDSKFGQLIVKGYDGELDPAKIREFAEDVGQGRTAVPAEGQPQADPLAAERGSTDERQALVTGAESEGAPPDEDPNKVARDIGMRELEAGAPLEEALGLFVNSKAQAAMRGDQRVTVDYQMENRRGRRTRVG